MSMVHNCQICLTCENLDLNISFLQFTHFVKGPQGKATVQNFGIKEIVMVISIKKGKFPPKKAN